MAESGVASGVVAPGWDGTTARPDELLGLAHAAARRDAQAAATLVTQLGGAILKTVRHVLGAAHPDVDDVAQEAVLAFLDALQSFRGECSTSSYAQRVALFTALAARRRRASRERLMHADPALTDSAISDEPSPLAHVEAERRRQLLRRALDALPDVIAEALALHFMLGFTVEEIAQATGAPANTVWSRLRLGKQALRKSMAAHRACERSDGEP